MNYGQPRSNNRQPQPPRNNQTINLSGEDFPDINGSTAPSPLASRLASVRLTERDHWPTLGEDTSSGRSSPNSTSESDTGNISRHAAALDQIANHFKNLDKVLKFRQLTSAFTSLSSDAETYVNAVYDLCDKDADFTAKILDGAKDLVDNRTLKNQMIRFWNQKNNPVSYLFITWKSSIYLLVHSPLIPLAYLLLTPLLLPLMEEESTQIKRKRPVFGTK